MTSTAAARVARCKLRKQAGRAVLQIEVQIGPLADQLAEDKVLKEWDTENRDAIKRALERMLAIYANGLPNPTDR